MINKDDSVAKILAAWGKKRSVLRRNGASDYCQYHHGAQSDSQSEVRQLAMVWVSIGGSMGIWGRGIDFVEVTCPDVLRLLFANFQMGVS